MLQRLHEFKLKRLSVLTKKMDPVGHAGGGIPTIMEAETGGSLEFWAVVCSADPVSALSLDQYGDLPGAGDHQVA